MTKVLSNLCLTMGLIFLTLLCINTARAQDNQLTPPEGTEVFTYEGCTSFEEFSEKLNTYQPSVAGTGVTEAGGLVLLVFSDNSFGVFIHLMPENFVCSVLSGMLPIYENSVEPDSST